MKKQILILLTSALFASCNDWLDVLPTDKTLDKELFKTAAGVQSATNGLYRELTSTALYGGQLSQTTIDLMAHFYAYDKQETSGSILNFWSIANFKYDHTDGTKGRFSSIWSTAYSKLLHINIYIENLKESPADLTEKQRKILLGEAYGLRAYLHFDLFRLFGPAWKNRVSDAKILPYHDQTTVTLNQTEYENQVYSTADAYMTLLWKDLNLAEDYLEGTDPILDNTSAITTTLSSDFYANRNRRMNYYALKGLQARVHQYCGNDAQAAIAAKVVTDRVGASGSRGTPFRWANDANVQLDENYILFSEVIFGLNNLQFVSNATEWYMATTLLNTYVVDETNLMKNILGYDADLAVMSDVRSKQWVISAVTDTRDMSALYRPTGTYISKKYRENSYTNIPAIKNLQVLMRISEMYYIQAEAALKAADKEKAIALLNEILDNRGLDITFHLPETATEREIQAHLEKEYYREFFGEGQVFFFHKRRSSTTVFHGNDAGSALIENPATAFVVPIPEDEKNI